MQPNSGNFQIGLGLPIGITPSSDKFRVLMQLLYIFRPPVSE